MNLYYPENARCEFCYQDSLKEKLKESICICCSRNKHCIDLRHNREARKNKKPLPKNTSF